MNNTTEKDKDKLASFWVQNVFSPLGMYRYFLATINSQRDKKAKGYRQPFYELDAKAIEKILNVLAQSYPEQYKPLLETGSYFLKGPKEKAIDLVRKRKEKNQEK